MYFDVFKHRKVAKFVRLRFCHICPESADLQLFLASVSNETHTQFSQTLSKEGLHRGLRYLWPALPPSLNVTCDCDFHQH